MKDYYKYSLFHQLLKDNKRNVNFMKKFDERTKYINKYNKNFDNYILRNTFTFKQFMELNIKREKERLTRIQSDILTNNYITGKESKGVKTLIDFLSNPKSFKKCYLNKNHSQSTTNIHNKIINYNPQFINEKDLSMKYDNLTSLQLNKIKKIKENIKLKLSSSCPLRAFKIDYFHFE